MRQVGKFNELWRECARYLRELRRLRQWCPCCKVELGTCGTFSYSTESQRYPGLYRVTCQSYYCRDRAAKGIV